MERSIFFFLKSHISAPGAQNSPIFFPSWSFPITFTCHNWFWSHLGPLHGRNWKNVSKKCFLGCPRFWVPPGIGCVCEQMVEMTVRFKFFLGPRENILYSGEYHIKKATGERYHFQQMHDHLAKPLPLLYTVLSLWHWDFPTVFSLQNAQFS